MPSFPLPAAVLALSLTACTPSLNWRDVRTESGELGALLPCKPDRGSRTVPLAGQPVALQMMGCEASGALFAIASAQLPPGLVPSVAISQWKDATLANIKVNAQAAAPGAQPFAPPGSMPVDGSAIVSATGQRANGSAVQSRAAYFAQGQRVYQAVVYADTINPEAADTFFASLKLQ